MTTHVDDMGVESTLEWANWVFLIRWARLHEQELLRSPPGLRGSAIIWTQLWVTEKHMTLQELDNTLAAIGLMREFERRATHDSYQATDGLSKLWMARETAKRNLWWMRDALRVRIEREGVQS